MVDYKLDDSFDFQINEWNDFDTVEGLSEFEQNVVVTLHDEQDDIIQRGFGNTARQKIRLAVTRTAKQFDEIDNIAQLEISRVTDARKAFAVNIIYDTGDSFSRSF